MATMVQAEPVVCIGSMLTRMDVSALCLGALRVIPDRMMTLPAAEVVMSILMKQHPCEELAAQPGPTLRFWDSTDYVTSPRFALRLAFVAYGSAVVLIIG